MLILPVILLVVVTAVIFGTLSSSFGNVISGGQIRYDEPKFQTYANNRYSEIFGGNTAAYEDNVLVIVLTNEAADGYYAIAWVGDNLQDKVSDLFGAEGTAFYRVMQSSINQEYFAYSLDSNLARAMRAMADEVEALNLDSNFYRTYSHESSPASHVVNYTALSVTENTVNIALEDFTDRTGIPAAIVVDTTENAFGKTIDTSDIITVVIASAVGIFAIVMIVRTIMKNRKNDQDPNGGGNGGNRYQQDFDKNRYNTDAGNYRH